MLACGVSGLAYIGTCGAFRNIAPAKCPTFNTVIAARYDLGNASFICDAPALALPGAQHKRRSGISASPEKPGYSDRIYVEFYCSSGFRFPSIFFSNSSIFLRISSISFRSSVICFFESPSMSL